LAVPSRRLPVCSSASPTVNRFLAGKTGGRGLSFRPADHPAGRSRGDAETRTGQRTQEEAPKGKPLLTPLIFVCFFFLFSSFLLSSTLSGNPCNLWTPLFLLLSEENA
jgi:hypothetical protein